MSDAYRKSLMNTSEADAGQVAKAGRWAIAEIERLTAEHGDMNVHCVKLEKEMNGSGKN